MKKLFAIMIVAGAFTACNDNTKTEENNKSADSTVAPMAPAAPDTAAMKVDTSAVKVDTTVKVK